MSAIYTALSGINVQQSSIDNVAANLANEKTIGYKEISTISTDAPFYNHIKAPGAQTNNDTMKPVGIYTGNGSLVAGNIRDLSQGDVQNTGNPLNFLINGSGYISVNYKGNTGFTRNGQLQISKDRRLQTVDGYDINAGDEITVPLEVQTSTLVMGEDGTIYGQDSTGARVDVGQLKVYTFDNEQGLQLIGNSFLQATDASGDPQENNPGEDGSGTIMHKALEKSNVNNYEQMLTMLESQRVLQHCWHLITMVHKTEGDAMESAYMNA
jgi:flagellar basal-body rod protein FlgG